MLTTEKAILRLCVLLAGFILPHSNSYADMGQIHVSNATVSESSQKAIILHNGTEEVLILGTDLQADRKTGLIRFIPFPSEPQVSLAPTNAFESVAGLLQKYNLKFLMATKGGATEGQAVELLLHQKLGAHDMTVIKVHDPLQFRSWANTYFAKQGLPVKTEYATAEAIVDDYVNRGLLYFMLDYVEVTDAPRFIEPVLYRFASTDLYYPLKTSNTFGGKGAIDLILFVPGSMCKPTLGAYDTCLGLPGFLQRVEVSTSAAIDPVDIASIYPDVGEFFAGRQVFMQMVTFWGDYAFDNDIFADISKALPYAFGHVEEEPGNLWAFPIEDILRDIENGLQDGQPLKAQ